MASTNLGTGLPNYRMGHPALGCIAYWDRQPVDAWWFALTYHDTFQTRLLGADDMQAEIKRF